MRRNEILRRYTLLVISLFFYGNWCGAGKAWCAGGFAYFVRGQCVELPDRRSVVGKLADPGELPAEWKNRSVKKDFPAHSPEEFCAACPLVFYRGGAYNEDNIK